jgi:DNA-directed RNA polymerase specialized sigma24 family protein
MAERTFTELIALGRGGDVAARNRAFSIVFEQLHRSAARLLSQERRCRTMPPTALVNEMFVRLHKLEFAVTGRSHFLSIAQRAMKQFLIDHGRGKAVRQRLDPCWQANLDQYFKPESAMHMSVRQVWRRLHALDRPAADALWAIKVEGRTIHEIARQQNRAAWRVHSDCEFAIDWIARELSK